MSIVELHEVSFSYKQKRKETVVIKNITCSFDVGKSYSIMGKSGSGKTTLLSLMAGLVRPDQGNILFGDIPLSQLDMCRHRRENVSVIYQDYNLFPFLNVLENAMYPLMLKNMNKKDAAHIAIDKLMAVGIDKTLYRRFPNMLSGGERQRVAIARTLCCDSLVVLADEPTGNLDQENGANVIMLLNQLSHINGRCTIIVTHDHDVANETDEKLRMIDGKMIRD